MVVEQRKPQAVFWMWLPVIQVGAFLVIIAWLAIDLAITASVTGMPVGWNLIWHLTQEVAVGVFFGALLSHVSLWLFMESRRFLRGMALKSIPLKAILVLEIYVVSVLVVAFTPLRPIVQSFNLQEAIPIMYSRFSSLEMLIGVSALSLLCLVALRFVRTIPSWRHVAVIFGVVTVLTLVITPNAAPPDYDYYISRARSVRFLRPTESTISTEAAEAVLELAKNAERVSTEPWQRAYSLYNQSRAYFWLGEYDRAKETALASRELNPENNWVHTALADIAIEEGNFREAEMHLAECEKWPEPGFPCYADERKVTIAWLEGRLSDAFALLEEMQTTYPLPERARAMLAWYRAEVPTPYLDKDEYLSREDAFIRDCITPYRNETCFREFIMLRWGNESFDRAIEAFEFVATHPDIYPFAESVVPLYEEMLADMERMEREQALTAEPVATFDEVLLR